MRWIKTKLSQFIICSVLFTLCLRCILLAEKTFHNSTPMSKKQIIGKSAVNFISQFEKTLRIQWARNNANTRTIRAYKNICIFPQRNNFRATKEFQGIIYSLDESVESTKDIYYFQIEHGCYNTTWEVITKSHKSLEFNLDQQLTFENKVAFFPYSWRIDEKATIFTLIHRFLPGAFDQIKWSSNQKGLKSMVKAGNNVLVAPLLSMYESFNEPFHTIGYSELASFEDMNVTARCFKYGVLGPYLANFETIRNSVKYRQEIYELLITSWGFNRELCPENNLVILERLVSRHLLNKEEILKTAKSIGFYHSNIVSFEDLSVRKQVEIVSCSDVFISVQGAALTWFLYLPINASVIEIVWDGWPVKYQRRIQRERPDISAYVLKCDAKVSENIWHEFAKEWFAFNGTVVSDEMKNAIIVQSKSMRAVSKQVWKYADCTCPIKKLTKLLPHRV